MDHKNWLKRFTEAQADQRASLAEEWIDELFRDYSDATPDSERGSKTTGCLNGYRAAFLPWEVVDALFDSLSDLERIDANLPDGVPYHGYVGRLQRAPGVKETILLYAVAAHGGNVLPRARRLREAIGFDVKALLDRVPCHVFKGFPVVRLNWEEYQRLQSDPVYKKARENLARRVPMTKLEPELRRELNLGSTVHTCHYGERFLLISNP